MRKKISQILFVVILALLATSCKNTKQKLQEYVVSYNKTAVNFKSKNVTLTTARGYINDNKIELRFETDLEQNEVNKTKAVTGFPKMLKEMIIKNEEFTTLVEEGVQFDTYFLAKDNTVLEKRIINKEEMAALLK